MADAQADIGLIGLAVMGQNLALNMADHGYRVAVYNRTFSKTAQFVKEHPADSFGAGDGGLVPSESLEQFVAAIAKPRRIVIMIKAGAPTDSVIDALTELLEPSDIIIDGGNANWNDTIRREQSLGERGILFVGSGVSGGEEGARFGPSLMPGGRTEAWESLKPVWEAIASKVDPKSGKPIEGAAPGKPVTGGVPCTTWIGPGGSGHYVKMVHNGIEYADMQMICEAYHLLRSVCGLSPQALADVFSKWNEGDLDSFLIEITADILRQNDPRGTGAFVDVVLDAAQQKGTGKWTSIAALDLAVPAPTIAEAVFARGMSDLKTERVHAADVLAKSTVEPSGSWSAHFDAQDEFIHAVERALYCAKICAYAQGFALIRAAGEASNWNLDYGRIAMIWRGGCIIRARFLQKITEAYERNPSLENLLLDQYFAGAIASGQDAWRRVNSIAAIAGIPTPAFSSALTYYDSYRSAVLPANLLQAQRDYFGAHTYERTDEPRGLHFHIDWPEPSRPELAS